MKISILIPCHNEEKSIKKCIESCLNQTRQPDEIVVVNDGSTDDTLNILKSFGNRLKIINLAKATGNKSYAQKHGLLFINGDVVVMTDGDTLLDKDFIRQIELDFQNPELAAVAGYVKSLKNNWLTALREIDYIISQNIYKIAQANLNFLFVVPGCAAAFRTNILRERINFDHDTITEDLDFTYKLHLQNLKIKYNRQAIAYTQDPFTLRSYINQMRRWYGGGWQNLMKHFRIIKKPASAMVLSLMYIEGVVFSLFIILLPLFNMFLLGYFIVFYLIFALSVGLYGAITRKRSDLLIFAPGYLFLIFINAWIFLEQFFKEVIMRRKNLIWFKPERANI